MVEVGGHGGPSSPLDELCVCQGHRLGGHDLLLESPLAGTSRAGDTWLSPHYPGFPIPGDELWVGVLHLRGYGVTNPAGQTQSRVGTPRGRGHPEAGDTALGAARSLGTRAGKPVGSRERGGGFPLAFHPTPPQERARGPPDPAVAAPPERLPQLCQDPATLGDPPGVLRGYPPYLGAHLCGTGRSAGSTPRAPVGVGVRGCSGACGWRCRRTPNPQYGGGGALLPLIAARSSPG